MPEREGRRHLRDDIIDELLDALNDGTEVVFDRDAMDVNRPEDWGAVELTGESGSDWADGGMTEQESEISVWLCCRQKDLTPKGQVQAVLHDFCRPRVGRWRLQGRNWLPDLDRVLYEWKVYLCGPAVPDTEPETEPDDGEEG